MKLKEIHDYSLALFIRSLGVWMLYGAAGNFGIISENLRALIAPPDKTWAVGWWNMFDYLIRVIIAAYFILGTPPLLKWAT